MKKIYSLLFIALTTASVSGQVVISQVYGGGGNANATFSNDFIELYNRGTVAQSLNGWSVQYASATGTSWAVTQLPNVSIQPGKYYLIQQAAGTTPSTALPTPDLDAVTCACSYSGGATPTVQPGTAMAASNGKIILVNTITAQTVIAPTGPQIIDKVGYGTANDFEGTAGAPAISATLAAFRKANGCTDTNDNAADFAALTPAPRNSASAAGTCAPLAVSQNSISGLRIYPNPVSNGTLFIETAANAEKTVTVYDVLGKKVLNTKTIDTAINISSLHTGVYIVNITEEGKTASRKLVIR
ncbi:lamin tail domain-containing protein [Flavobacterium sp.]|uniref:T9SS type A sorting domain-containing protein n=1 Tax=Flavobacterium sp. TaxID=239 RepID=UPI00248870C5|nr:lamin tail domain-containing protein [Flavobacterium sp.]MDI1316299.1 lamin tail domain-containing protein [Flavobacterium sp.]